MLSAILISLVLSGAQANPCSGTATTPALVVPGKALALAVELSEHTATAADGSQLVTDYLFNFYDAALKPVGADTTLPKSAFTLAAGTTNCYQFTVTAPASISSSISAGLRARRAATSSSGEITSALTLSDHPFSPAPSVLAAPGRLRIVR